MACFNFNSMELHSQCSRQNVDHFVDLYMQNTLPWFSFVMNGKIWESQKLYGHRRLWLWAYITNHISLYSTSKYFTVCCADCQGITVLNLSRPGNTLKYASVRWCVIWISVKLLSITNLYPWNVNKNSTPFIHKNRCESVIWTNVRLFLINENGSENVCNIHYIPVSMCWSLKNLGTWDLVCHLL